MKHPRERGVAGALNRLRRRKPRGRVLAVKWGLNPNSSSLGVDVTFLLMGTAVVSLLTPVVSAIVRARTRPPTPEELESEDDAAQAEPT